VFPKLECQAKVARPQLDLVKALQNSISEEENVKTFQERYGIVTHLWMTHIDSLMNDTHWLTYEWDLTHLNLRYDSFTCVTWCVYIRDTSRLNMTHDAITCETWLIYIWDMTHLHVRHDFISEEENFKKFQGAFYDVMHLHLRQDSLPYLTWLIYVRYDSSMYETWLMWRRDMTHVKTRHDSFTDMISRMSRNSGRRTVMWPIYLWDMTHFQMWGRSCRSATHCDTLQHTATHRNTPQHNTGNEDVGQNALFDPWENEWPPPESIGTSRVRLRDDTWDMTYLHMSHDPESICTSRMFVSDLNKDMTHLLVRHESFTYETWHESFTYETWRISIGVGPT